MMSLALQTGEANAADMKCKTRACFLKQVAVCSPVIFDTQFEVGGLARYKIYGPTIVADECCIDFEFLKNPNPSLIGPSFSFVVQTKQDLDAQLKQGVAECVEGKRSSYRCSGDLWELSGGGKKGEMRFASEPPCGVAHKDEGSPLYPMPKNGRWWYVNWGREWVIEPHWARADIFSEGRAVVGSGDLMGIIDRGGQYVLEPFLKSIRPFFEGCPSATHFHETRKFLFVARNGSFWNHDTLPEGATNQGFGDFGDFSEGKAWFNMVDFGPEQNKYGWIDKAGDVVIPRLYSGAGNFVDGLAPAAQRGVYWVLMDESGKPRVLDRWRFSKAIAFSKGLSAIRIDVFTWMYMSRERIAIDKIIYKTPHPARRGPAGEAAIISRAGSFHDGLAPVRPKWPLADEAIIFIRPDGSEAFTPVRGLGLRICSIDSLPEFHNGLVRLLVANDGDQCGDIGFARAASYDSAHFVYRDTTGKIVLEQAWREGDVDAKP